MENNEMPEKRMGSAAKILIFLVIIVAIVAVILIFSKVNSNSKAIALCQSINAQPVSCIYNNTDVYGEFNIKFVDAAKVGNITLSFTGQNGETRTEKISGNDIGSLEQNSFIFSQDNVANAPASMSIIPEIIISGEKFYECPVSTKIDCNLPTGVDINSSGNSPVAPAGGASHTIGRGGGGGGGGGGGSSGGSSGGGGSTSSINAPSNLMTNVNGDGSYSVIEGQNGVNVTLTWQDNSNNEDNFYVDVGYNSTSSDKWNSATAKQIAYAKVGSNVNSVSLTLPMYKTYVFRVYAYSSSLGNSSYSNDAEFSVVG